MSILFPQVPKLQAPQVPQIPDLPVPPTLAFQRWIRSCSVAEPTLPFQELTICMGLWTHQQITTIQDHRALMENQLAARRAEQMEQCLCRDVQGGLHRGSGN